MKLSKSYFVLAFLLSPIAMACPQASSTGKLHYEIQQLYNFEPHTLSDAQRSEKSSLLDQFWTKAKAQRDVYAPGLRQELADLSNPPFFLFDGSELLMSISNDPADNKIILAAVAHSNLQDIQSKEYFLLVHKMAAQGEDTTVAAFHVLSDPKFQVFIPQHALTLGQNYCLIYMLLPTNQDFWLRPAIERLQNEADVTAGKSLLLLLWYAQTPDADKAIAVFSTDATKPQASKAYANELLHRDKIVARNKLSDEPNTTEQSLRQARQQRLKAVSDEALDDLDTYTAEIISKRK
jgi:hypothetical protein